MERILQEEDYTEPPQHYFGVPAVGARSPDALENAVKTALKARGTDRDRGRGRFRPLCRNRLRLMRSKDCLGDCMDMRFAAS